ncbi:MAG TPA: hypothetical protein VJ044_02985, partial [Candidatus Hodarchaeales archaeon]|nr:hypothetical protein [Candidatus Hodarchaeales archaeon]
MRFVRAKTPNEYSGLRVFNLGQLMTERQLRGLLIYSNSYLDFDLGAGHPMSPKRILSFKNLLESMGFIDKGIFETSEPELATDADLLAVHDPDYIQTMKTV